MDEAKPLILLPEWLEYETAISEDGTVPIDHHGLKSAFYAGAGAAILAIQSAKYTDHQRDLALVKLLAELQDFTKTLLPS